MFALEIKKSSDLESVEDFLVFAKHSLQKFKFPHLEAEMLLSFVLQKERVWIKTHLDYRLNIAEKQKSREIITKRANHEPLAYIRGWKMWHDLKINVSPDVLIPRDETEILVNYILESIKQSHLKIKNILDIGTGSGCLSIFFAKKFSQAEITAIDISENALKIAKKNATNHNVKINFINSDLFKKIPLEKRGSNNVYDYDIIVANLPYVPENIEITEDVKKEPYNAIFAGKDGLDLIKKLAKQIKLRNVKFQELWLEFWQEQEPQIITIFAGFEVEFFPDLSGDTYFAKIIPKTASLS